MARLMHNGLLTINGLFASLKSKEHRGRTMKPFLGVAMAVALAGVAASANAAVIRVPAASFVAGSGVITFSGSGSNPTYAPADYGGGAGSPTVKTKGWFTGQSLSANPGVDCPGGAASACVVGNPTGPLTLDPSSPNVFITGDGANPTSPVLSGTPTFNGPIAVWFDVDQYGVGFDGGYFNAVGSTGITAFDRAGNILGTVSNEGLGIEFLGLVTNNGIAEIAGVFLDLVGPEPAGFAIDNLRFGKVGQVVVPGGVPEPATWLQMIAGFGLVGVAMRYSRKAKKASTATA